VILISIKINGERSHAGEDYYTRRLQRKSVEGEACGSQYSSSQREPPHQPSCEHAPPQLTVCHREWDKERKAQEI
jgi:hypothetical protein